MFILFAILVMYVSVLRFADEHSLIIKQNYNFELMMVLDFMALHSLALNPALLTC